MYKSIGYCDCVEIHFFQTIFISKNQLGLCILKTYINHGLAFGMLVGLYNVLFPVSIIFL